MSAKKVTIPSVNFEDFVPTESAQVYLMHVRYGRHLRDESGYHLEPEQLTVVVEHCGKFYAEDDVKLSKPFPVYEPVPAITVERTFEILRDGSECTIEESNALDWILDQMFGTKKDKSFIIIDGVILDNPYGRLEAASEKARCEQMQRERQEWRRQREQEARKTSASLIAEIDEIGGGK